MFDSVSALIEEGETFAQCISPATIVYGNSQFPCTIGQLKFHEFLGDGGFRQVKQMHIRIRRADITAGVVFKRGQDVIVKRKTRGDQAEEQVELKVGDANGSDAVTIRLTLEREPV